MTANIGAKDAVVPFFIDFKLPILLPYNLCASVFMATKPEPVIYIALVS